jgi:uncharacterized Rossmann fold enzyme
MTDRKEVELARDPTEEELRQWYDEHSIKPDENGQFVDLPYGEMAVKKDDIIEHVRLNSLNRDVRNLTAPPFGYNPKTMVFVCGGPTLEKHLPELLDKSVDPNYEIYTSNKTCKYLLEHGIVPKFHVILDPTEKKKKDLDYDCDEVTLLLALQCDPAVFAARGNRKAFKFIAVTATDRTPSDLDVARENALTPDDPTIMACSGGSMMGTRALFLASSLGYRRIEYYGFDACIDYDDAQKIARMYSYDKQRGENILEVEAGNGRKFYSTLAFSRQCNEIVKLMDTIPGMEVIVHGDSFMSNQVEIYKQVNRSRTYRFTEEYARQNEQLHREKASYGTSGHHHASRVFMAAAQICRKSGVCEILDYGCGKETLRRGLDESFPAVSGVSIRGYDPCIPGLDQDPVPADLVVCTDVMEHVEPPCVEAVIKHLHDLTKQVLIVDVHLQPAVKTLPDGRNAHICLRDKDWWKSWFSKYFVVIEQAVTHQDYLMVLQPIWKYRERKGL